MMPEDGPAWSSNNSARFQLFDALPSHIEDALRASIERFGVLVPVVKDQHGNILDGHHRARMADRLGVRYRVDVVQVADEDEAREIAHTLNSDRRQLTDEQRRAVAVDLRQRGHSYRAIAGALGVSEPTVRRDVQREEIASGDAISQPDRVIRQGGGSYPSRRPVVVSAKDEDEAEKAQTALVALGDTAEGTFTTREAVKLAARQREPEAVPEPVPPPPGRYRCIVIDPPWPMQKIERDERPDQGVTLDYPVMSIDDIADERHVPVRTLADEDCHIYLWVTHKYLPDGLDLLNAWGFNYQCVMTWRKNVGITPFSWMYDTEHVLFGRRGNLPLDRLGLRLSFDAPVQGHSRKPDVFYDRVLAASPGPRVEMFSRSSRDGFVPWGNEVASVV